MPRPPYRNILLIWFMNLTKNTEFMSFSFSGSTPYWDFGAPKQYYVSKRCSTKKLCKNIRSRYMPYCTHIWYEDYTCAECCLGDRCNYYVIVSSISFLSNIQGSESFFGQCRKFLSFKSLSSSIGQKLRINSWSITRKSDRTIISNFRVESRKFRYQYQHFLLYHQYSY